MPPPALPAITLPFGRHRGEPLGQVPTSYLCWFLAEANPSTGLRAAVAAELRSRGYPIPDPPPPPPIRPCRRCGSTDARHTWQEDSAGNRRIRRACAVCRGFMQFAALLPAFIDEANHNASRAPVLDVLTRLEELGIDLVSDGRSVGFPPGDYERVPADLRELVHQCNHTLAGLLGVTRE
jgi:hypothetical protein